MNKKHKLHPRNRHQLIDGKAYDFEQLSTVNPELRSLVKDNGYGVLSIDFADDHAVKQLNKALLLSYYGLQFWDIPDQFLCPPVPGRADYLHYLADLLALTNKGNIPNGKKIVGLDIGTGANLIYPIIGSYEYKWQFVGSDIDSISINCATQLIKANPRLNKTIKLRTQSSSQQIFTGVINDSDRFAFTMCNPPFHSSAEQAAAGTKRKLTNLGKQATKLNFGGRANELWCEGGEREFITKMVDESRSFSKQVLWFTCLISNNKNIRPIEQALNDTEATQVKVIEMAQGNKLSRFIAWTYFSEADLEATQQQWFG